MKVGDLVVISKESSIFPGRLAVILKAGEFPLTGGRHFIFFGDQFPLPAMWFTSSMLEVIE